MRGADRRVHDGNRIPALQSFSLKAECSQADRAVKLFYLFPLFYMLLSVFMPSSCFCSGT